MSIIDARRCAVLLALQQALLGEVTAQLRAVTVTYTETRIHFEAYYEGEIGDDEIEAMSLVATEVLAVFPSDHTVTHDVIRLDAPALLPRNGAWVYHRKEPLFE